jgi:thiol-disulfide isomerase/thioredoxin
MRIVKINSLGCPSCIIMNKVFNQIKSEYNFDLVELDYDFDDIEEYNPGKILPIFIFYKDEKEICRLCGEHKLDEFKKVMEELK